MPCTWRPRSCRTAATCGKFGRCASTAVTTPPKPVDSSHEKTQEYVRYVHWTVKLQAGCRYRGERGATARGSPATSGPEIPPLVGKHMRAPLAGPTLQRRR